MSQHNSNEEAAPTQCQSPGSEKPVVWTNKVDYGEPYGERFRAFVTANRDEQETSNDRRDNRGSCSSNGTEHRNQHFYHGNTGSRSLPTDPMEYVRQKRNESRERRDMLKHKLERYQETIRNRIQEQEALLEKETQYKNTENNENAAAGEKNEGNLTRIPSVKSHTSQQKENGGAMQYSSQSSRGSSASTMEGKQDSSRRKH
eukprot:gb/GECG01013951.1/.p1 GENE.gb/GECG01013951.1/~~gb/GECG01013951.1/.p1  ORF type:complete len:202 (+),score=38.02 gb/GECG01013951.1/:1-606(+)